MSLPLMTTRRWLLVVALVAFCLGSWLTGQRARMLQKRAADMEYNEMLVAAQIWQVARSHIQDGDKMGMPTDFDPMKADLPAEAKVLRATFLHYRRLKRQYRNASQFPWFSLTPDP